MKKRITTEINYKWSDCKISQIAGKEGEELGGAVRISYLGEVVCLITGVKDYTETSSLIRCMFQSGIMYSNISISALKRIYNDTVLYTFQRKVEEDVEKVIETVDSVKIESLLIERTYKKVKKWIKTVNNLFWGYSSGTEHENYKKPIPNLRFNLY
jgi:hypothetical protein